MGDLEDMDDVLAFFQNCYHMKEWIINDSDLEIREKKRCVEDFINNSEDLRICGDLCIGSKHLTIKRPRKDSETKINRHFWGGLRNYPIQKRAFIITSDGRQYDAMNLATKCVEEWRRFFKNNGIYWS